MASAACFALRLHASAAPPRVGLTQALGGRKAFDCCAFKCSPSRLRVAPLFGQVVGTLLLRSSSHGALTQRMRCVDRLRKRCLVSVSVPLLTLSFLTGPAESSRCASGLSRFGFRQVCQGVTCIGIHRRLTIRSSRPHVVASATCFTLRLHVSAAPPRVGLTQALGGRKTFVFSRTLLAEPLRSFSLRHRLWLLRLLYSAIMQCFG